jgi:enoyl-CoA hydratase
VSQPEETTVLVEQRGPSRWLTLNRPAVLNALNTPLVEALRDELAAAEQDDSTKVVVLRGAGRAFCSGYDLSEEETNVVADAEAWHGILARDVDLTMQLFALAKPTIAAVHGWVLAGGCELAMACDLVVATQDARFGEPEIRFGSGPVALLMPFVIGMKKTNELLLTGDTVDAVEAHRLGLVNHVVPAEELVATVDGLVRKIAPAPLRTLRLTKLALVRAAEAMGLRAAVQHNLDLSAILNAVEDPETAQFAQIVRTRGLKAALAWRDARYDESLG